MRTKLLSSGGTSQQNTMEKTSDEWWSDRDNQNVAVMTAKWKQCEETWMRKSQRTLLRLSKSVCSQVFGLFLRWLRRQNALNISATVRKRIAGTEKSNGHNERKLLEWYKHRMCIDWLTWVQAPAACGPQQSLQPYMGAANGRIMWRENLFLPRLLY